MIRTWFLGLSSQVRDWLEAVGVRAARRPRPDAEPSRPRTVREVMRPRTEVVALPLTATEDEVRDVLRRERYTRYPVYASSLDDIVGVFLAKDFWQREQGAAFSLARLLREPLFVPETRPAERVLDDLRKTRAHVAVVLDEFGGTAGMATLEDLVDQVLGDLNAGREAPGPSTVEANRALENAGVDGRRPAGARVRRTTRSGDVQAD